MNRKNNLSVHLKALVCLFWGKLFMEQIVEVDFQKELSSNKQLASSESSRKNRFRLELHEVTIERAILLRRRLILSLVWILSACCVAFLVIASISNIQISTFLTLSRVLALSSIVSFAWATLGRLGWAGQSFKGDTVFEQLDDVIFRSLYWVGTLLGTLAFLT